MTSHGTPSRGPRALVLDRSSDVSVRVRRALALLPDGGEVITCSEIGRVEKLLASTPVAVVVAGPNFVNPGGLQRLARLHARAPWLSILLVSDGETEASLAEIVQAGADDVVPLEASDAALAAALTRGHRITHRRFDPARGPARPDGVVVTIASASEGCGKTFLGVNAAAFLTRRSGKRVVLVDLDLQFGEVATALRLRAHVTMVDALAAEADGHDLQEHLDDFLLPHPDGFHVLAAPRNPAEADAVEPDDVRRLLALLRTRADYIIVDSPTGLSPLVVAALEATDHLYVLATPDRPSLVNLGLFLHAIDGIGPPAECVTALLNKAEPDMGIDPSEMAGYLTGGFAAVLPYDREVPRSVNLGVPILTGESRSPVSVELIRALTPLLPASFDKPIPARRAGIFGPRKEDRRQALDGRQGDAPAAAAPPPTAPPVAVSSPEAPPAPVVVPAPIPAPPSEVSPAIDAPAPIPVPPSEISPAIDAPQDVASRRAPRRPCPPRHRPPHRAQRALTRPSRQRPSPMRHRGLTRPHGPARGRERAPPHRRATIPP